MKPRPGHKEEEEKKGVRLSLPKRIIISSLLSVTVQLTDFSKDLPLSYFHSIGCLGVNKERRNVWCGKEVKV